MLRIENTGAGEMTGLKAQAAHRLLEATYNHLNFNSRESNVVLSLLGHCMTYMHLHAFRKDIQTYKRKINK